MLVVKVTRIKPGQVEPEALVATSDQAVCQVVLRLIRERLAREEGNGEPMTKRSGRSQTDD